MSVPEERARRLPLEGPANFRDLGGYPTRGGGHTAWGKIYRSDTLAELSPSDLAHLGGLALRTAVDLRSGREVERHPNALAGADEVSYHHLPVPLPPADVPVPTHDDAERARYTYLHMLDHGGPTFRAIFERLADPDAYPFVFHCTSGKDRTGVVAAVLLLAAGVERDVVLGDYAATMDSADELAGRMHRLFNVGQTYQPGQFRITIYPSALTAVLDRIGGHYGTVDTLLARAGVTPAQLAAFRAQFVVPPG